MAEFIVAIELGSSKITGIAGRKNIDGSVKILAVVKEDSTQCIRNGVVYNIDRTCQCLTNIVNKLKTLLKTNIAHVYVGVGGQSIRSVKNVIVKDLAPDTVITKDMIDELMDGNRSMTYPDQEILDAITQEYKVDAQLQIDPIGIPATRLEGNFLNILWRKTFYRNLNKCFDNAGIAIAEMYLAPLALADSVLSEAEKRSGCVLVDLGSDTTTVSVYYKNILRHLAVIPLGSANITRDIASLQMEESEAEKMKLKYASAFTDGKEIDETLRLPIDKDRQVDARRFIEIVEARVEEIVENAWFQVPSEYADKLLSGIVLTGGGSNMKNIERSFRNHTHVEKIRIAKFVTQTVDSTDASINAKNGTMNTVLGLLAKGNMNCAGPEIDPHRDLFDEQPTGTTTGSTVENHQKPRKPGEITGQGVVLTEAEKSALEEEKRKAEAEAEEERLRLEKEAEEERLRQEEKKKNSSIHKFMRGVKDFFNKMYAPDTSEED